MKILFVSAVLPYPLYSGGQVRIYNLLKELGKRHEITLYSFIRNEKEREFINKFPFCKKVEMVYRGKAWQPQYVWQAATGPYPLLLATYTNTRMKAMLTKELGCTAFDLVHIEPGYVWPSLPTLQIPLVVSEHNLEHSIYQGFVDHIGFLPARPILQMDVNKLMSWERKIWAQATEVVAVSEEDREAIGKMQKGLSIEIVPNGVDPEYLTFIPKKKLNAESFTCLFVGSFAWMQNRDAVSFIVSEIWPKILEKYPQAHLKIVGKGLPPSLRNKITHESIVIDAGVEDIRESFHEADLLLAPIRIGGGTKYKILEAMACGLPVITTAKGAEGLEVHHKKELWIGNTVSELVQGVAEIISDDTLRKTLISEGRKKMEKQYSWKEIAKRLESAWETGVKTYGKN